MTVEHWSGTGSELAERIKHKRPRHLVVISRDKYRPHLYLDADEVARQVGGSAEIVIVENGRTTYELEENLPPGDAVYGNAGRVYPGDLLGYSHTHPSVPILAERADLVGQRTQDLINLVHGMPMLRRDHQRAALAAAEAEVSGTVVGVHDSGEIAYVLLEDGTVTPVRHDSLVPGVRLDWYLPEQLEVAGTLTDAGLDLRHSLLKQQIMDVYSYGDVVLALVKKVRDDYAYLEPLPGDGIRVSRNDVTSNEHDSLTDMLTVGEVVPARLISKKGKQRLCLHDVGDDDPIHACPSLIAGGAPWLVYGRNLPPKRYDDGAPADAESAPEVPSEPEDGADAVDAAEAPAPPVAGAPADRTAAATDAAGQPARVVPQAGIDAEQLGELTGAMGELLREVAPLKALLAGAQRGLVGPSGGKDSGLREQLREQQAEIARLREEVDRHKQQVRDIRRRAKGAKAQHPTRRGLAVDDFLTVEDALRHEVYVEWVSRVDAAEKPHFPLPDHYDVGPKFADSFVALQPDTQGKALKALVDILTGRAQKIPSRQVHALRTGDGGDDPQMERADGSKCFRASVEVNAPSARRIHYWKKPDGTIELHEVVVHDKTTV
ncbi:hypothetical protein [Zhihengliuella salsuginis]|uniref:S1 motif domain-containing protein n=1 Tax=Zhihengliuella salsuginis TaxID=578222 RepID=A0ABQ3GFY8_9MICC|nr:hypothetical protein [Zhihengliuella salsuginis]GHD03426.1 hypothetical protein GCM10008096_09680 [Zhihengliuella salsuginis]